MSDKYIVIINKKDKKNNVKYFLINKNNNKLHNIIENHAKTHKPYKTITGGTKGQNDKEPFNPLANPFNPLGAVPATPTPKSPTTPKSPKSPKSSASSASPKTPIGLNRECTNILRQEHVGKKEYMSYKAYRYHDDYAIFREYNEIDISIPDLKNAAKKRKNKPIQQAEIEHNRNGMTNIGAVLYNSRSFGSNPPKIGTIIAANSGRPGGACGNFDGTADKIHPNHRTQEEDIVSNWFMTYVHNKGITEGREKEEIYNKLFGCTIYNKWGLAYPYAKKEDKENYFATVQGINYSNAIPREYADAWTIDNVYLSDKRYNYRDSQYIHEHQYKTTLVFVSGPNNNNPGMRGPINSVYRTYNEATDTRFDIFIRGVEAALFAALIAMVRSKCNVALLVYVSGGVYRGKHDKQEYRNAYENALNNLLMNVQINGVELGSYFDAVYLL